MCQFIATDHTMPGYICCKCHGHNGLQRSMICNGDYRTLCRYYGQPKHASNTDGCALTLPPNIRVCLNCHAGYEANEAPGMPGAPIGNAAGETFRKGDCIICCQPFIYLSPENDRALYASLYGAACACAPDGSGANYSASSCVKVKGTFGLCDCPCHAIPKPAPNPLPNPNR